MASDYQVTNLRKYNPDGQRLKISTKQRAVLTGLLNVALSGWYTEETLPPGIASVEQAEQVVKSLIKKL